MKWMIFILILMALNNCAKIDYDFNPTTTIIKQLLKGNDKQ